jgi:glutaconate CoA-transferase subunit B
MPSKGESTDYTLAELMAILAAKEIKDGDRVFVGIGVPMIAAFLAIHTHAPNAMLMFEGGYLGSHPPVACTDVGDSVLGFGAPSITSTWRTFSDLQHGYCDIGIIGSAQVDKYGNVNSTAILGSGTYENPKTRLPGSGGANDIASSAGRLLIMARLEKRRFVPRVDYATSPGHVDGYESRWKTGLEGGGPTAVITDRAIFRFDKETKEMYLSHLYPGVSVEEVKKEISWDLTVAEVVEAVEPPTRGEVNFIRNYDPTDVILRRRRLFDSIDFSSWSRLAMADWNKRTQRAWFGLVTRAAAFK